MTTDTGGPYCPSEMLKDGEYVSFPGATLLDEFAKAAMQPLMRICPDMNPGELARWSYDYAEAMVAEKRKREKLMAEVDYDEAMVEKKGKRG